jgi:hypothetical protein
MSGLWMLGLGLRVRMGSMTGVRMGMLRGMRLMRLGMGMWVVWLRGRASVKLVLGRERLVARVEGMRRHSLLKLGRLRRYAPLLWQIPTWRCNILKKRLTDE